MAMERMPLEWIQEIPPVTRAWTAAITVVSILEQCKIVNELDLLYSYKQVFVGHEYWRLLTSFVYFGPFSINLIMYAYFVARYSRMLEESFYLNRASQYMWLIAVIATSIVVLASFLPLGALPFLGPYLANALVYIWARRNPQEQLSLMGLFAFSAPYLPWVLMLFSAVVKSSSIKGELLGVFVGHMVFFLEDIYPSISGGVRVLRPPWEYFMQAQEPPTPTQEDYQQPQVVE